LPNNGDGQAFANRFQLWTRFLPRLRCADLTLVSRDTHGFLNAGVRALNPFSS
jgi:hypothetical protein